MMKLRCISIIISITFSINGSQNRDNEGLQMLFYSATVSAMPGHLGIFYDPNYLMKKDALSLSDLCNFRYKDECKERAIVDYLVDNPLLKMTYYQTISSIKKKDFLKLLEATPSSNRGLVLYYTINNSSNKYLGEIKKIRETGWHVIVMCLSFR